MGNMKSRILILQFPVVLDSMLIFDIKLKLLGGMQEWRELGESEPEKPSHILKNDIFVHSQRQPAKALQFNEFEMLHSE